jgi:hypothetical protein
MLADGMIVEVLIGLCGKDMTALLAAGQPVPAPVRLRAAIDTGTNITCVNSQTLLHFGLPQVHQSTSTTVGGTIPAFLYEVSFGIPQMGQLTGPLLVIEYLVVMELAQSTDGIDVLIGRDVLRELLVFSDGPRDEFTLAD